MIDKIVLIVGPMRSGTSMVAQVVHRLGWQASPVIGSPIPPAWRSDWEDPTLSIHLMEGYRPSNDWWTGYLHSRRTMSVVFGFGGRFAIKSPYLALVWPKVLEMVPKRLVVLCTRSKAGMLESFYAHPKLREEHQAAIQAALKGVKADLEVNYEAAVANPKQAAVALARALGVEDDRAVSAAAGLIGSPTKYL